MAAPTVNQLISPSFYISVDTAVLIGDLIGWDATNLRWTKADADTATQYAQFVAVSDGTSNQNLYRCLVSKEVIIEDLDAPYTQAAKLYLSSTAGESTHTRPVATSTARLVQTVGYALDTFRAYFKLGNLNEMSDYQQFANASISEVAARLDDGNFYSPALDATTNAAYLTCRVPDKAVSLAGAWLYFGEEAEASTITLALTVGSALHDAQHDAITQDATITAFDIAAAIDADDIGKTDVSTAFDATNIIRPGALLGVAAVLTLGGTDEVHLFGIEFVWNTVD